MAKDNTWIILAIIAVAVVVLSGMQFSTISFNGNGYVTVYRGENVFFRVCSEGGSVGTTCQFMGGDWDATTPWYIYVDGQLVDTVLGFRQQPSYYKTFNPQTSFEITPNRHDVVQVSGCMDSTANNFNPSATIDDGSCRFSVLTPETTPTPTPNQTPSTMPTTSNDLSRSWWIFGLIIIVVIGLFLWRR